MSRTTSRGRRPASAPAPSGSMRTYAWRLYREEFASFREGYSGSADSGDLGDTKAPIIVDWLPTGDAENPQTYPAAYKWAVTALAAVATLGVGFCSSAYAGALGDLVQDLGASPEGAVAGISAFVLGFALGPLLWAPLSEVVGRRAVFIWTYAALVLFNAACAVAPGLVSLVVLRFLAGAFGSSPLTNAGGTIADMFGAGQRGLALSVFAAAPFMGPVIGPIVGGFTSQAVGWRWVMWVCTIYTGCVLAVGVLLFPETYAPVLLRRRAAKLSAATGREYRSKYEAGEPLRPSALLATALTRPWALLLTEPIVLLLSLYMAIIYGVLYLCFAAFPIVYQKGHGWSAGLGGLAFTGMAAGMLLAVAYNVWENGRYVRLCARLPGGAAPPEARLPPAIIGGAVMPVGLFWFAWTNGPGVHWAVSIAGTVPFGFGMVLLFLAVINYLIDSYLIYAASVMAASAVLRSLFGAVFPLFTREMYNALGVHWASSIPAFLALACLPFPPLFYRYGARIRARCRYAAAAAERLSRATEARTDGGGGADADVAFERGAKAAESVEDGGTPPQESLAPGEKGSGEGMGGGKGRAAEQRPPAPRTPRGVEAPAKESSGVEEQGGGSEGSEPCSAEDRV
ncbi:hypothetical protein HYH03_008643 [Edaphochlamys debaryana]|uniref:Major facilitator superfamily (MFS) profile domain-containing protein n=1 Tax=Edaphochlamys debaryana TaxID=47281 RepID=A0A836BYR5_9CHLO|nr:hypothetical protein HYH03_008643 [Edaphochlamys debaryana]|eukprot:KAG2493227.1 hypothetical protein HYH03_008643 [Edaphochlamys debaryana]